MPTNLHTHPTRAARYFSRRDRLNLGARLRREEVIRAPFLGWCPDLPPHIGTMRAARNLRGLIPRTLDSKGQILANDDGFEKIDSANLPLGNSGAGTAITLIHQFRDGTGTIRQAAIAAGDGGGTELEFYQFTGGAWAAVSQNAGVPTVDGDRDTIRDAAVFPFGCPSGTRTNAITGPLMVVANSDLTGPTDVVLVWPDDTGFGQYDELDLSTARFAANSAEAFGGRVVFLGVDQAGTVNLQRLVWTAVGTAHPDLSIVGSGFLDFAEFDRPGLRAETLGNKIACYFEDGVAFAVPTGTPTDAFRPQIVSRRRGLLGTNALIAIDRDVHFGIFDDGWWILDSAGQWTERGILQSQGQVYHKFRETFYQLLDAEKRNRISLAYDEKLRLVRIAFPTRGDSENTMVLNYHVPTDSVWPDYYEVTAWGGRDEEVQAATTYAALDSAGTTYADLEASATTYADFTAIFGLSAVNHGSSAGNVFGHTPDVDTYDGVAPPWLYQTHEHTVSEDPLDRQTFQRLGVEYRNVGGPGMALEAQTLDASETQTETLPLNEGAVGQMHTAFATFRLDGTHHAWKASGTAPVAVRSFVPRFLVYGGVEDLEGQGGS